jgi:hypothetical protein
LRYDVLSFSDVLQAGETNKWLVCCLKETLEPERRLQILCLSNFGSGCAFITQVNLIFFVVAVLRFESIFCRNIGSSCILMIFSCVFIYLRCLFSGFHVFSFGSFHYMNYEFVTMELFFRLIWLASIRWGILFYAHKNFYILIVLTVCNLHYVVWLGWWTVSVGCSQFFSTVDPMEEPTLVTAKNVLSILSMDYPVENGHPNTMVRFLQPIFLVLSVHLNLNYL